MVRYVHIDLIYLSASVTNVLKQIWCIAKNIYLTYKITARLFDNRKYHPF